MITLKTPIQTPNQKHITPTPPKPGDLPTTFIHTTESQEEETYRKKINTLLFKTITLAWYLLFTLLMLPWISAWVRSSSYTSLSLSESSEAIWRWNKI